MKIKTIPFCGKCDRPLAKPEDGFIIHGNIYVADLKGRGGLIGNNFPLDKPPFTSLEVRESALCRKCMLETLLYKKGEHAIRQLLAF